MTADDNEFKPRLGKIRSKGAKRARRYLQQVLRAAASTGAGRGSSAGTFHGNRIGRGAGVGRVLAARDRSSVLRSRRVIVKARIVRLKGSGAKGARLHLRYLQRDGVTREGTPGELYDRAGDRADGQAFLDRGEGDRHQFRFIVAPEDGEHYADLQDFTRRLMARMEQDLGTRLDWVAVDHFNTGHPHVHVILRGRAEDGGDLVIAREYLSQGLRERAAEIVALDLGPRTDREIEETLRREVEHERFTSIDKTLLRDADSEGRVTPADHDPLRQSLRAGRLQKLRRFGLAEEDAPGHWHLAPEMESTLRRMGERGDILKTMHRALAQENLARSGADLVLHDSAGTPRLTGRVIARGLADETEHHYLVLDATDGRVHYVDLGSGNGVEPPPEGTIIAITPRPTGPRPADRIIAEVARANGGRYDLDTHLRHDPASSQDHAEAHIRRLESLRRAGLVERGQDGGWTIPPDYLDKAAAFERNQARAAPVIVEILSPLPLARQIGAEAATWLDRELIAEAPTPLRDSGFGREVKSALAQRRQWLLAQGFAEERQDHILYRRNLLSLLRRRELARVAVQLSREFGLPYAEASESGRVEGVLRRRLDLASGRFAVIEKSREFTLVPWRPVLERSLGKAVAGIVRGESVTWTLGRQRSGPSIG